MADTDFLAQLGRNIKTLRTSRSLTQGQLAAAVGLSRGSIANIEAARQEVSATGLLAFARSLGVGVAELTEATTEPGPGPWLELAQRVTAGERHYAKLADECWKSHDVLAAVRWRGVAEGLAMARDHQLTVTAEMRGESRG